LTRNQAAFQEASDDERAEKLVAFEALFFHIDDNASGSVDVEECDLLFSFAALDLDPAARRQLFRKYDMVADGKLSRVEFVTMCVEVLWRVPSEQLRMATRNLDSARKGKRTRNQVYWQSIAHNLDSWARVGVPTIYIFGLIIMFHLELSDEYLSNDNAKMFKGVLRVRLNAQGQVWVGAYLGTCCVIGFAWLYVRAVSAADVVRDNRALTAASRETMPNIVQEKSMRVSSNWSAAPAPATELAAAAAAPTADAPSADSGRVVSIRSPAGQEGGTEDGVRERVCQLEDDEQRPLT